MGSMGGRELGVAAGRLGWGVELRQLVGSSGQLSGVQEGLRGSGSLAECVGAWGGSWGWQDREALQAHQASLDLPIATELPSIPQPTAGASFTGVHQSQEPN